MQTNPAVEQNKNVWSHENGPRVRRISQVGKEKVYGGRKLCCARYFLTVVLGSRQRSCEFRSGVGWVSGDDSNRWDCRHARQTASRRANNASWAQFFWYVVTHRSSVMKVLTSKYTLRNGNIKQTLVHVLLRDMCLRWLLETSCIKPRLQIVGPRPVAWVPDILYPHLFVPRRFVP